MKNSFLFFIAFIFLVSCSEDASFDTTVDAVKYEQVSIEALDQSAKGSTTSEIIMAERNGVFKEDDCEKILAELGIEITVTQEWSSKGPLFKIVITNTSSNPVSLTINGHTLGMPGNYTYELLWDATSELSIFFKDCLIVHRLPFG